MIGEYRLQLIAVGWLQQGINVCQTGGFANAASVGAKTVNSPQAHKQ